MRCAGLRIYAGETKNSVVRVAVSFPSVLLEPFRWSSGCRAAAGMSIQTSAVLLLCRLRNANILARLRPRKLAFGHGHPVTSGSPGIDYFVSSELFETSVSIEAREARRNAGTSSDILKTSTIAASAAAKAKDSAASAVDGRETDVDGTSHISPNHRQSHPRGGNLPRIRKQRNTEGVDGVSAPEWRGRGGGGGGDGEQDYAEQLVFFDSLTASLPEAYGPANAPSTMAATLAAAGAPSSLSATTRPVSGGDHFYHCMQHAKKFHPTFDRVLRGVLQADPAAKILLAAGSEVCLTKRLGLAQGPPWL